MTALSLASAPGTCAQEGCRIASTGSCARGFDDPLVCENFEPEEATTSEALDNLDEGPPQQVGADPDDSQSSVDIRGRRPWRSANQVDSLHSGHALTLQEATMVRQRHSAAVVVPIGEVDVGKTTLIAGIFEAFASAPTGEWSFVGSLSLMGFEARSHNAMVDSGRAHPDTPRTSRNTDQVLLHLSLAHRDQTRRHLLLADVSGEHAESLRRLGDAGDYKDLLQAATCVLLMVDGEELASATKRHAEITRARTLYKAMSEGELLAAEATVIVTVTKWDLCAEVAADVTVGVQGLLSSIHRSRRNVVAMHMAVRPRRGASSFTANTVDDLVERMMQLPERRRTIVNEKASPRDLFGGFSPGSNLLSRYVKAAP